MYGMLRYMNILSKLSLKEFICEVYIKEFFFLNIFETIVLIFLFPLSNIHCQKYMFSKNITCIICMPLSTIVGCIILVMVLFFFLFYT